MGLFGRKSKGRTRKIFFASDLHGSERCFLKFVNAAKHYGAEVLICGGDLTGKMIVPIVKHPDGTASARVHGEETVCTTDAELAALKKRLAAGGYYPYETDDESVASFDEEQIERLFEDVVVERLRRWIQLAEERLDGTDIRFFWMAGNDDQKIVDEVMASSPRLTFSDHRVVEVLDGWEMVTLGVSNITPWQCPRDLPEEEIAQRLDDLASSVSDFSRCIFNVHVPPAGTKLDQAPELDSELRPKLDAGGLRLANVGSTALREAIERYSPALSLHGHIHESAGVDKLGSTVCVNPGSDYQEGVLRGALIVLNEEGGVRDWALTVG